MATSLTATMLVPDSVYFNKKFLNQFEDHIPFIRARNLTNSTTVTPAQALQFKGDFFGLLRAVGIPERYHYPALRLSGLTNSTSFTGENPQITEVSRTFYDNLANTWKTQNPNG